MEAKMKGMIEQEIEVLVEEIDNEEGKERKMKMKRRQRRELRRRRISGSNVSGQWKWS
jgi:hypothetical protein